MPQKYPPRLHVLLARDAATAVVFRRGPSRQVAVIGWNRDDDTFELGQWLKGRIYERRSDLSPDGRHLIYFAMNGLWSSEVKGSWTAISQAPFLKAMSLYAKGDCWHGGGLFLTNQNYWLNDGYGHKVQLNDSRFQRESEYPWHEHYGGECLGVYYLRLQRDGWQKKEPISDSKFGVITVFEKSIHAHWILRKLAHATSQPPFGRGAYFDTHELCHQKSGQVLQRPDWEWADVDRDRLVWAAHGILYSAQFGDEGLSEEKVLFDFSSLSFENREAPY